MKLTSKISTLFFIGVLLSACQAPKEEPINETSTQTEAPEYAIVIHGGAGYQASSNHSEAKQKEIHEVLNAALDIGEEILKKGGTSLLAVEKTINFLENAPQFNAGKGAVFTHDEKNELDASIMQGVDHKAGAIGGVTVVKNPISAAIAIMNNSEHVMMVGKGAEEFAQLQGLEIVDPSYFLVEDKLDRLHEVKASEGEEKGDGKHQTRSKGSQNKETGENAGHGYPRASRPGI